MERAVPDLVGRAGGRDPAYASAVATLSPKTSFHDISGALTQFEAALKAKGFKVLYERAENHSRDYLVYAQRGSKATCFYLKFKREFFYSYGKIFGEEGAGDSINKALLDSLIEKKVDVLIFAHTPHLYYVYPMQIKNYCEERDLIRLQNKANLYVAGDYKGTLKPEHEETYSFGLWMLRNLDDYAQCH